MTDTSKVRRTAEVDGIQELSRREMLDVTGGFAFGEAQALKVVAELIDNPPQPEPEVNFGFDNTPEGCRC